MKIKMGVLKKVIREIGYGPPGFNLSDKAWPDSPKGVKAFAAEFIEHYDSPDSLELEFIPDPEFDGVWLMIDHTSKRAFTIYLNENDFEGGEEMYEKAAEKYGRGAPVT